MAFLISLPAYSQQFFNQLKPSLGWASQPDDTMTVAPPEDYGDVNDFSGGYAIGDTVADFTAYDFDGYPITLSEQLTSSKQTVLINGSVSCIRFRNTFDTTSVSQEFAMAQQYMYDHASDFNWIFIYNMEAHPSVGPCPSNCPNTPNMDTTVVQHPNYLYRRWAMQDWLESDSTFLFPWKMYCDNPDNNIYNNFFRRPYGILVLNCEGIVEQRGDWAHQWLSLNIGIMDEYLESDFQQCQTEPSSLDEQASYFFNAFPVPFENHLTLNNLETGNAIAVKDITGRSVYQTTAISKTIELHTENWLPGIYLVEMIAAQRKSQIKVIKN